MYKERDDYYCLISSPIYVDSRKEARKKEIQSTSNATLHSPKKFTATIGGVKASIPNSTEGFINYYGAQNIRNKIKHPFYIAYHFDRVFKLYSNSELNTPLPNILTIIESSRLLEGTTKNPY
jgi:hypothetical protein